MSVGVVSLVNSLFKGAAILEPHIGFLLLFLVCLISSQFSALHVKHRHRVNHLHIKLHSEYFFPIAQDT